MCEESQGKTLQTDRIVQGDALEVLAEMPDESVHAVVCDPPYGLNFMGRDWDNFRRRHNENDADRDSVHGRMSSSAPASGAETDMHKYQDWCRQWASEALDVLKPGGHLLAFSGNRTHHRLFSGVEDAGFEVRDTVTWHYGSGFPKALDVSKAIDKAAGADREVIATREADDMRGGNHAQRDSTDGDKQGETMEYAYTAPATDEAKRWDGFKTALKPATEYVVVARKPLPGTVAECVQEHGTGALNIDGCRVGEESLEYETTDQRGGMVGGDNSDKNPATATGRYPSNVVFGGRAAAALDREVGELSGGAYTPQNYTGRNTSDAPTHNDPDERQQLESGGPSRYFYTSKATRAERTADGKIANAHPTVKPTDLMEWLVKLVTAEGQVVVDPFAGSGTTCLAAKNLNRRFIGIEQQAKWCDVARVRCGLTPEDPAVVRDDDAQAGLEAYGGGGSD